MRTRLDYSETGTLKSTEDRLDSGTRDLYCIIGRIVGSAIVR